MFRFSLATSFLFLIYLLLSDTAIAGVENRETIDFRSWSKQSCVAQLLQKTDVLNVFSQSLNQALKTDEEFSQLQDIKIVSIYEGDSNDSALVRLQAQDKKWADAGPLFFDLELRVNDEGNILSMVVTAWSHKTIQSRAYYAQGPRYDLPRAIHIN